MSAENEEQLVRNMDALSVALSRVSQTYGEHVVLSEEDPETFGAGHFVLYPAAGSRSRLAIEEQYTGTDWSDPDRVPTSWTWQAETLRRQGDGTYEWVTLGQGEVASGNVEQLIAVAETWANTTHGLAAREANLSTEAPTVGEAPSTTVGLRTYRT